MSRLKDFVFYEESGITLYCGDCREVLPILENQCQTLLTDPPYGIQYRSGWSGHTVKGDHDTTLRDWVLTWWSGRPAIIFGTWSVERPPGVRQILIWDKGDWPGMGDLSFPWGLSHEEIYVMGDGFQGQRMGTVIRSNRITSQGSHPTEKPVDVLRRLLIRCPPGVILDPFCGSGGILEAAKQEKRCAIGIEIEPQYCEIAVKRIRQEVLPHV